MSDDAYAFFKIKIYYQNSQTMKGTYDLAQRDLVTFLVSLDIQLGLLNILGKGGCSLVLDLLTQKTVNLVTPTLALNIQNFAQGIFFFNFFKISIVNSHELLFKFPEFLFLSSFRRTKGCDRPNQY